MYLVYRGVKRGRVDVEKTRSMAKAGDIRSQHLLGGLYYEGLGGVGQSYRNAYKWWRLAATKNDPLAQNDLAILYVWGRGTVRNYQTAAELLKKSAQQKHAPAMLNLAILHQYGIHVTESYELAAMWAKRAAEGAWARAAAKVAIPVPEAQFYYAQRLAYGLGVERNWLEAYRWSSSAAVLADRRVIREPAESLCTKLEGVLTKGEIATVQTFAAKRFNRDLTRRSVQILGPESGGTY